MCLNCFVIFYVLLVANRDFLVQEYKLPYQHVELVALKKWNELMNYDQVRLVPTKYV